jgi:hypothetical protein
VIAKRLRLSDELIDQQWADAVEIWLTRTLSMSQLKPYRDRESMRSAINVIADQSTRDQSRRRAILASWRDRQLNAEPSSEPEAWDQFGGLINSNSFRWYREPKRSLIMDRLIDSLVEKLIRMVDAGSQGEDTDAIRRELHSLMSDPTIAFENGHYAREQQASVVLDNPLDFGTPVSSPGCQWYAPWESEAAELKKSWDEK